MTPFLLTAIIGPGRADPVVGALVELGASHVFMSRVLGFGREGGRTETHRGGTASFEFAPKLKVEAVFATLDASDVVERIAFVARSGSGRVGDGKVWTTDLDRLVT